MTNTKGVPNYRIPLYPSKPSFLPPRSPFPSISQNYADHLGQKSSHAHREVPNRHQRTSSESFLSEEQPSWLEDLLSEPEMPLKKGLHRRSSSDSFAYTDMSLVGLRRDRADQEGLESRIRPVQYPSFPAGMNNIGRTPNRREAGICKPTLTNMIVAQQGPLTVQSDSSKKRGEEESGEQDSKHFCDKREDVSSDNSQTEADSKRVKQKFAQRSRVRKLQYIAELERNCQALQAGGSEVSAELKFLDQQNLILNLENTALKQRLDSLAQEHFIKHLQQEMLEREIARLRELYHQQKQQQMSQHELTEHPITAHRRTHSRDLDNHFAGLSLKHRESNPGQDPVLSTLFSSNGSASRAT